MRKPRDIVAAFTVPIYNISVSVHMTDDLNAARSAMDKTLGTWESDPDISALCAWNWPRAALFFSRTEVNHGEIGHEVFHLACRIMESIDAECECDTSEEPYAYLIDWLTTRVYAAFAANGVKVNLR